MASTPSTGVGHVAPFHDGHGIVLDHLGDGEVGDLGQVLQAIEIGVQERPAPPGCLERPARVTGRAGRRARVGAHRG